MSLVVLAIAAAHALPPIIGAIVIKNKGGVIVGAVIGGLVALLGGSPAFIFSDLLGLAAGTWLSFAILNSK